MASKRIQITWKTILFPALGLLAFILYLYFFNVDIPKIIATVQEINFAVFSLAIIAVILEVFFFALCWRSLLNFLSVKLSIAKSLLYVWLGIFMDILIPAESISGEILRTYLITREQDGTSGKVVASLVTHRLIGMGVHVLSLFVGLCILLSGGQFSGIVLNLTLFLIAATTILLGLLFLLCTKEVWTLKIVDSVIRFVEYVSRGRWKLANVREQVFKAAKMFHDSMKELARAPKTLFTALFFHVFSWLFSIGVSYFVFLSIGFSIHWSVIIITCSIVAAVKAIPLGVPFEIGLPEITMSTLYIALLPEIPVTISATATILTRILTVWFRFLIGFAVQQWLGIRTIVGADRQVQVLKMEKP